jgi:hypothetical protein
MADRYATVEPMEGRRSTGEIVQDIINNTREIIRSELQLAKTEVTGKGKRMGKAAGILAAGGAIAAVAALLIVATCVAALALFMPVWAACLIMAVLLGAIGGGMILAGRQRMKQTSMVPERTISSLKEDVQWLKHPTR